MLCILVLIVTISCTGCFDQTEVDDLNTVVGLGFDRLDDDHIQVTVEIVNPESQTDGRSNGRNTHSGPIFVSSQTGATIPDALDKFTRALSKVLYLSHNSVVVFGKDYAEHGISEAFDYLERAKNIRRNQLWVVTRSTARELLESNSKPQPVNAFVMRDLGQQMSTMSRIYESEQLRVMRQYFTASSSPLISCMDIDESGNPYVSGIGVFNHDKLVTVLPFKEANILTSMLGKSRRMTLTVDESDDIEIRVIQMSRHVVCNLRKGTPVFEISLRGKAVIEHLPQQADVSSKYLTQLNTKTNQTVVRMMNQTVRHLQDLNCDATQLGDVLFHNDPQIWRKISSEWNERFPKAQVSCKASITIVGTGLASSSPTSAFSKNGFSPGLYDKE